MLRTPSGRRTRYRVAHTPGYILMLHGSMTQSRVHLFTEPKLPSDECPGGWRGLESPDRSTDETGTICYEYDSSPMATKQ